MMHCLPTIQMISSRIQALLQTTNFLPINSDKQPHFEELIKAIEKLEVIDIRLEAKDNPQLILNL